MWLLIGLCASAPAVGAVNANAQNGETPPPTIRRVSDGERLQVGDVFGQLKIERDDFGNVRCVMDRSSTEISVETSAGQEGGVSLEIDKNCVVRVVMVGPYEDATDSNAIKQEALAGK